MINATTTYTLAQLATAFATDEFSALDRVIRVNAVIVEGGYPPAIRVNDDATVTMTDAFVRTLNELAKRF